MIRRGNYYKKQLIAGLTGSASKMTFINLCLYIERVGPDPASPEMEAEISFDPTPTAINLVRSAHWRRLRKKWKLLYFGPSFK